MSHFAPRQTDRQQTEGDANSIRRSPNACFHQPVQQYHSRIWPHILVKMQSSLYRIICRCCAAFQSPDPFYPPLVLELSNCLRTDGFAKCSEPQCDQPTYCRGRIQRESSTGEGCCRIPDTLSRIYLYTLLPTRCHFFDLSSVGFCIYVVVIFGLGFCCVVMFKCSFQACDPFFKCYIVAL